MADRNTRIYKWKSKVGDKYTLYADGGVIIIINENTGEQHQFTMSEARDVYKSLGDISVGQELSSVGEGGDAYIWERDEYKHNRSLLEVLRLVYADAKQQGDPTKPEVQKARRQDRNKSAVVVTSKPRDYKLKPSLDSGPGGAVIFN